MKIRYLTVVVLSLFAFNFSAVSQTFTYKWQRVAMDTLWDNDGYNKTERIIERYRPGIEPLMEIVGYASEEVWKESPESALSNLATDALLFSGKPFLKEGDRAFSLTNFGGIRANLPKGAIRIFDVYSVFPFDNEIVVAEISGKELRSMLERFASRYFEALGGLRIAVKDGKIVSCEVGGAPLDDSFTYKLVTIDFLLDGGDSIGIDFNSGNVIRTGLFIRDGVINYIKDLTKKEIVLNNKIDGRVKIIKD